MNRLLLFIVFTDCIREKITPRGDGNTAIIELYD